MKKKTTKFVAASTSKQLLILLHCFNRARVTYIKLYAEEKKNQEKNTPCSSVAEANRWKKKNQFKWVKSIKKMLIKRKILIENNFTEINKITGFINRQILISNNQLPQKQYRKLFCIITDTFFSLHFYFCFVSSA